MTATTQPEGRDGQATVSSWGFVHLFMGIALLGPIFTVTSQVRGSGGGLLRYAVGLAAGALVGSAVVVAQWRLGGFVMRRVAERSDRAQTIVYIALLFVSAVWVGISFASGEMVAALLTRKPVGNLQIELLVGTAVPVVMLLAFSFMYFVTRAVAEGFRRNRGR